MVTFQIMLYKLTNYARDDGKAELIKEQLLILLPFVKDLKLHGWTGIGLAYITAYVNEIMDAGVLGMTRGYLFLLVAYLTQISSYFYITLWKKYLASANSTGETGFSNDFERLAFTWFLVVAPLVGIPPYII